KAPTSDRSGTPPMPSGSAGTARLQPVGFGSPSTNDGPEEVIASTTRAMIVLITMPRNRPPGTFRTTSTPQMMMPRTNTAVGHDTMWPPMPSCTGTVVFAASGMRRTRPPSTKPMMAMNMPMPTAIADFSDGGIALNTADRKPDTASSTMMMPSSTTRPIASGQLRPCVDTKVTATSVLMPRPAAMPNGYLAHTPK